MKIYKAMVWEADPNEPGRRVTILAESFDDAKGRLEAEYGEGHVYDLHNEDEAAQPRDMS